MFNLMRYNSNARLILSTGLCLTPVARAINSLYRGESIEPAFPSLMPAEPSSEWASVGQDLFLNETADKGYAPYGGATTLEQIGGYCLLLVPISLFVGLTVLSNKRMKWALETDLRQVALEKQHVRFIRENLAFRFSLGGAISVWAAEFLFSYSLTGDYFTTVFLFNLIFTFIELILNIFAFGYGAYFEKNERSLKENIIIKTKEMFLELSLPTFLAYQITYFPPALLGVSVFRAALMLFIERKIKKYNRFENLNSEGQPLLLHQNSADLIKVKKLAGKLFISPLIIGTLITPALFTTITMYSKTENTPTNSALKINVVGATAASIEILTIGLISEIARKIISLDPLSASAAVESERAIQKVKQDEENILAKENLGYKYSINGSSSTESSSRARTKKVAQQERVLGLSYMAAASDYRKAFKRLRQAAKQGDKLAYCYLGFLYEYGLGVEASIHAALFCYEQSDSLNCLSKLIRSVCYLRKLISTSLLPINKVEELLSEVQYLGNPCESHELEDLIEFLEGRANAGDISAELILWCIYTLGLMGIEKNQSKAEEFSRQLSENAEPWTQYHIGVMYEKGYGVARNVNEAKKWFKLAAKKKYGEACFALGQLYLEGRDVPKNYKKAMDYFKLAANSGNKAARYALARMYEEGLGVDVDKDAAEKQRKLAEIREINLDSKPLLEEEPLPTPKLGQYATSFLSRIDEKSLQDLQIEGVDLAWVQYDYDPPPDRFDLLPIKKGQILYIEKQKGNWWRCENQNHQVGMVPNNFIKVLPRKEVVKDGRTVQLPAMAIEIMEDEIEIKNKLGEGAFGNVFLGIWTQMGMMEVALKRSALSDAQSRASFERELKSLVGLRHPNIVGLCGYYMNAECSTLVMEYMNGGSLWDGLGGRVDKTVFFEWMVRWNIAMNIANGLYYLHSEGVLHRDLKSANVLLCDFSGNRFFAKLADFGEAHLSERKEDRIKTLRSANPVGTQSWMAPELLSNTQGIYHYKPAIDIYSFGIILWELATHEMPYLSFGEEFDVQKYVSGGGRERIPDDVPYLFQELIRKCWAQDPNERAQMPEILQILAEGLMKERSKIEELAVLKEGETIPKSNEKKIKIILSDDHRIQIRETDIEEAIISSLQNEKEEEHIGPREIAGFKLKEVSDDGNCFYYALASQLELTHRKEFLSGLPKETALHDSLRLLVQGEKFKDKQWSDIDEIFIFAEKSTSVVAIIDTRSPENGFRCYFSNGLGAQQETHLDTEVPSNRPVIRLAYTGDHYLSVLEHMALRKGAIRGQFNIFEQTSSSSKSNTSLPRLSNSPLVFLSESRSRSQNSDRIEQQKRKNLGHNL